MGGRDVADGAGDDGIAHRTRQKPDIENGRGGGFDRWPVDIFERNSRTPAQNRQHHEDQTGDLHGLGVGGGLGGDHHIERPENSGEGYQHIALRKGTGAATAQSPDAATGEKHCDPKFGRRFLPHQAPQQQRRNHHIKGCQEPCVCDRGGEQAVLLQHSCGEKHEAADDDQRKGCPEGCCIQAGFAQGKGCQGHGGQKTAKAQKLQRAQMVHGSLLKIEAGAPEGGSEQNQQRGSET